MRRKIMTELPNKARTRYPYLIMKAVPWSTSYLRRTEEPLAFLRGLLFTPSKRGGAWMSNLLPQIQIGTIKNLYFNVYNYH